MNTTWIRGLCFLLIGAFLAACNQSMESDRDFQATSLDSISGEWMLSEVNFEAVDEEVYLKVLSNSSDARALVQEDCETAILAEPTDSGELVLIEPRLSNCFVTYLADSLPIEVQTALYEGAVYELVDGYLELSFDSTRYSFVRTVQ